MTAYTPNYNLILSVVYGDIDLWGGYTNSNWSAVDALIKSSNDAIAVNSTNIATNTTNIATNTTNIALKVSKAGDTMTGELILPAADPLTVNSAARRQYSIDGELALLHRYTFNTVTTTGNPGTGKIGLNAANTAAATKFWINNTKADGSTIPIAAFVIGYVIAISTATQTAFYKITAATDHGAGTWCDLTVTYIASTDFSITNGAVVLLSFVAPNYTPSTGVYTEYDAGVVPSSNTRVVQAHGLAAVPSNVVVLFKCTTTNGGYAVGDYIPYTAVELTTGNADNGSQAFASGFNVTEVWLSANSAGTPGFTNKAGSTTPMASTFTPSSWHVIFRVWA